MIIGGRLGRQSLVDSTMPDWLWERDPTKYCPWPSRLGVGRGANHSTPQNRGMTETPTGALCATWRN